MADYARLAASLLGFGSLLCQLILLVMQLRTYRRTGIRACSFSLSPRRWRSCISDPVSRRPHTHLHPVSFRGCTWEWKSCSLFKRCFRFGERHRCFAHSLPAKHRAILKLIAPPRAQWVELKRLSKR